MMELYNDEVCIGKMGGRAGGVGGGGVDGQSRYGYIELFTHNPPPSPSPSHWISVRLCEPSYDSMTRLEARGS